MEKVKAINPTKAGQIAKFHTPLPDENPDQLYVVLNIHGDGGKARTQIYPLRTGLQYPPTNTVYAEELEVVELPTDELIGHKVTIRKEDDTLIEGEVLKADKESVNLDLNKGNNGVDTNVRLTVIDNKGKKHQGFLYVVGNKSV